MPKSRFSLSINLSEAITNSADAISKAKTRVRQKRVSAFNDRVVTEGLDLESQITFWEQMEREEKRSYAPLQDNITESKNNVSSLKKQVRGRDFRKAYADKLTAIAGMKDNYENLIEFLNGQLKSAVDEDLKTEIRDGLTTANTNFQTELKNEVTNLITTGERDNSLTVLGEAKTHIQKMLGRAIASDDPEAESYWKGEMSTLTSKVGTVKAENAVNAFTMAGIQGKSPVEQLSIIRKSMAENQPSANDVPITLNVGGQDVTFSSVHAYLSGVMVNYLEDDTKKGFFGKMLDDNTRFLDTVIKTTGEVPLATIDSMMKAINSLKSKPGLAPYLQKIEDLKYGENGLITKAVDANVERINSRFLNDLDLKGSLDKLKNLSTRYGVNTDATVDKLIKFMGDEKIQLAQNIVSDAASMQADDPNLSWADAVKKAVDNFRGGIISPSKALEQGVQGVATEVCKQSQALAKETTSLPGSTTGTGGQSTRMQNIANTNPNIPANTAFIDAVYLEASGRRAVAGEYKRFVGMKASDVANIVLRAKSPFKNPLNKNNPTTPATTTPTAPIVNQTTVGTAPIVGQTTPSSTTSGAATHGTTTPTTSTSGTSSSGTTTSAGKAHTYSANEMAVKNKSRAAKGLPPLKSNLIQ